MAVKLRMTRMGRRHRPFFRINAIESRAPRDGKILEKLGHYDPLEKDKAKQVVLNRQRVEYWLEKGAIPSDTVSQILLREGIKHKYAEEKAVRLAKAKAAARAKGKFFTEAEKIAAEKAAKAAEEKAAEEKAAEEKAAKEKAAKAAEEKAAEEKAAEEKAKAQARADEEKTKVETEAKPSEQEAKAEEKPLPSDEKTDSSDEN